MWRSERRLVGLALGALLGLGGLGTATAGPLGEALERELAAVRAARDLVRAIDAVARERDAVAWSQAVLEDRARQSVRRVDAYRVAGETRREQAAVRARAMYKLARGGVLRLYFEDAAPTAHDAAAERVGRGRTIRWLVRHDLRELGVHTRAERRARTELLAATRELAATSSLRTIHELEDAILRRAAEREGTRLVAARHERQRAVRRGSAGAGERALLREVLAARRQLDVERRSGPWSPGTIVRPVAGAVVGPFGAYEDPVLELPMHRDGVELRAGRGEPVRALADGTVAFVGALPGFDEIVVIDHADDLVSLTARLMGVDVATGDPVTAGAVLGRAAPKQMDDGLGRTVYLELRAGERPVDPSTWLSRARTSVPG
jgi:septal ring factor EnvC (AmiA/AmiB activator)